MRVDQHPLEISLHQAQQAVQAQSWLEAWSILEKINPDYYPDSRHLGALREDFELIAATCMRHRGQFEAADKLYTNLQSRLSLRDERLADALLGRAECAHAVGNVPHARMLMKAAERVPMTSTVLALRVFTAGAHIASHVNIDEALDRFEWIDRNFPEREDSSRANFEFWYADALLVAGRFKDCIPRLVSAHRLAVATSATITTADAIRRLPLARVLCGQTDYALRGLGDLNQASQLYKLAGDRGAAYVHTEAGETYRAIGKLREAERAFSHGVWESRNIQDENREAHNQIGLFEVGRMAGNIQLDLLITAEKLYNKYGSDWGLVQVQISRALADLSNQAEHIKVARELISSSRFSRFERELEILSWIETAKSEELATYPHLMNYP